MSIAVASWAGNNNPCATPPVLTSFQVLSFTTQKEGRKYRYEAEAWGSATYQAGDKCEKSYAITGTLTLKNKIGGLVATGTWTGGSVSKSNTYIAQDWSASALAPYDKGTATGNVTYN